MKTSLLHKAVLLGTLAALLFSTINVSAQPLPAGSPAQAALPTWVLEMDLPIPQVEAEERGGAEAARQMLYDLAAERADGSAASLSVSSPRETAEGWEYTLRMEGQSDFEALRQLLYAQLGSEFDFLGGPIDLSLDLPEGSVRRVDLLLESRPTTGYAWELSASAQPSWALRQPVQNAYRSGSLGAPAVSTLSIKAAGFGGRPLSLQYRRSFEAQNATRRLWIEAAALPETLDLTSPLPAPDFSMPPLTAPAAKPSVNAQVGDSIQSLPASFDWRTQGVVTEVRNQGGCGSCWAFGTVGPLESALLIHENLTTDLSEQYLVSCNQSGWSCSGGWWAHDYHMDTYGANSNPPGAVLESDKTYTATNGTCGAVYNHPYRLYNWNKVDTYAEIPSVEKIKQAIYEYGPISASVCAEGFGGYSNGVFDTNYTCYNSSGNPVAVNHGIVLVGWEDATQSWILRNSWGPSWGEGGYMRIRWGVNNVGYDAAYIVYEEPPAPSNDDFDSPERIESFPYTYTQMVDTASTAADPILAYGMKGYKTLWFRYTPSQDGTLTVDTQGSFYDTMLGVWTGSRGSLTLRAFNDDITSGSNLQSRVELDVTAGIPYQIEVANYADDGGLLILNASFVPAGTPCYTLSTSANPALGGSVQADPAPNCGSKYTEGTVVTLSASPADGYTFTSWGGDASGTETPTTVTMNAARTVSAQFTAEPAAPKDWTFMVFLDGDNNLESYAIADFLEMSAVGSNADLNIVVQMDRISGYETNYGNWTDTRRFYVTPSMTPLAANGTSLGEVNMGSPEALTDFISWTVTNYPAEHYAVVLWDHGDGWLQASPEVVLKSILSDSTNGDHLQMPELRQVLSAAAAQIGHPIDLLGFDACLMAMTEVDNQIIPYASVRVGSEKTEPGDGWPYTPILSAIVSNPAITPDALGTQIVESYYASYFNSETQAAVDLGAPYTALNTATHNLAQALITAAPDHAGEILEARLATLEFDPEDFIDLYDFAAQVQAKVTDAAVQNAAQAVQTAVSAAVLHNRAQYAAAHGISVYFPLKETGYADDYDGSAGVLQFTANTAWDEWLHTFYDTPLPAPANDLPANATVFTTLPYTANQLTYGAGGEESGDPNDNTDVSATVWYKFTAYASGSTTVHTSGSDYNTLLTLFRQQDSSLVKIGENNNVSTGDTTSRISFQAAAGSTYYFRIGEAGPDGLGGSLKFSASGPALECYTLTTSVQPLEGGQVQVSPAPNCPIAGKYLKNTTLTLTAVPAEEYRFGGWSGTFNSVSNPFQVTLTSDAAVTATFGLPPDNDTPAGAVILETPGGVQEARFTQTVDFATSDPGDPVYTLSKKPFQGYRTVWYQITPFASGTLKVNTFGSDYDTVLGVWTRTADQWTRVTWNDNRPNQKKNSSVSLTVNPGTTYYVEIAAKSDTAQNLVVNTKFTPRKASNNLIAYGRLVRDSLTGTDFQRSDDVYAATTSLLDPVFPGIGQGQRSVWYRFTPLRNGTLTVSTEGSQYDTLLGVWYGSRSAPQLVAWDDNGGAENTSRLSVDLVGRVTYYIEVAAAPGALGSNLNFQLQFAPAAALGENHYEADLGNLTTLGLWEDGGVLLTSSAPRASAGLNFEGRQIRLAYSRLPLGLGKLRVKVDGVTLTTLNQSSPLVQEDGLVWTSKLLKAGAHTLTLESVSGEVNLDWIEVLP